MKLKLECLIFYLIARILLFTYRIRYFGVENYYAAKKMHPNGGFCLGTWHEYTVGGILGQKGILYCLLVSPSRDGDYVSFIAKYFGYQSVRGSSSRGGKEARRAIEQKVSDGIPAAFTVDGPRGPRRKCKLGVMVTAKNTNSAVLPVAAVSAKPWIFSKSWDKTKIPKFFSKVSYQFGKPIPIPEDLSSENYDEFLEKIGEALNETERLAYENLKQWSKGPKFSALKNDDEAMCTSH